MLDFIDISNWKSDLDPDSVFPSVDAVFMKATGGNYFVDKTCDRFVQAAKRLGKPWGFYHYAHDGTSRTSAEEEAKFFCDNCENYFGEGIPCLDWEEDTCDVDWVNAFVAYVHDRFGIWPWIYANPWRFNQGGVNQDCDRWLASYPQVSHPTFDFAKGCANKPDADGPVCAWQFCSDGIVAGYNGVLDCNLFFGDVAAWKSYALGHPYTGERDDSGSGSATVLEGGGYKVTIEKEN